MKKLMRVVALAAMISLPVVTLAENIKIGVVDMRAVISSSKQAKDAMEKLKKEFKVREDKIVALDKSVKEKTEKLQRNAAVMSGAEKEKLEKEVLAGQRDLQRLQTEFREDAAMRQQEEMKKVVDKVNVAVQEIAKKENYDLVLHNEAAPFASKNVDLTEKVIKAIAPQA